MSTEAPPLSSLSILLVEDEPSVAKLLRMTLQDLGAKVVHSASDGNEALRYIDSHEGQVNTVISDWNMPNMDGMQLLRQIRSVDPEIEFVMVTGRATPEGVMEARSLHVSAFIAKPFEPETIRQKLISVENRQATRKWSKSWS